MASAEAKIQRQLAQAIAPYREAMLDFLAGRLSADDFQTQYLDRYLNDTGHVPESVYGILDTFFGVVECYTDKPGVVASQFETSEREVREATVDLLRRAGFEIPPEASTTS